MKRRERKASNGQIFGYIVGTLLAVVLVGIIVGGYYIWKQMKDQVRAAQSIEQITEGVWQFTYEGDYGFDEFLAQGGAQKDEEIGAYLSSFLGKSLNSIGKTQALDAGCSSISTQDDKGHQVFGRNFDIEADSVKLMITITHPKNGYASVATACLDVLGVSKDYDPTESIKNEMISLAAIYVPLDGMNECGLCVANLMAGDTTITNQDSGLPDLTTLSVTRLLLDKAKDVDEALALLRKYDIHTSLNKAQHLAISDLSGKSVVVEWVNDSICVTETASVTNHYMCDCEKKGLSEDQQSQYRLYQLQAKEKGGMSRKDMRELLEQVGADGVTQWSVYYDKISQCATWWFRHEYNKNWEVRM